MTYRFASILSSLDPQLTKDGEPYAPKRYKEIVKECYLISKNTYTSYTDVRDKMTPVERNMILEFIMEEYNKTKELLNKK